MSHSEIVSFLWGVADLIRDTFKRGKYQDVILPLTVLRRLDCVLAPTKERVLAKQAELRGKKLKNLDPQLRKASGFAFYNTSRDDFGKLLADAPHLAANLRNYIAGFSPSMREVLEKFDFDNALFRTARYMQDVYRHSHGIADDRNRLYWDDFQALKSPVPPRREQERIVRFIQSETARIDELQAKVRQAIDFLREFRAALVSVAVTGKIDVQETAVA